MIPLRSQFDSLSFHQLHLNRLATSVFFSSLLEKLAIIVAKVASIAPSLASEY